MAFCESLCWSVRLCSPNGLCVLTPFRRFVRHAYARRLTDSDASMDSPRAHAADDDDDEDDDTPRLRCAVEPRGAMVLACDASGKELGEVGTAVSL